MGLATACGDGGGRDTEVGGTPATTSGPSGGTTSTGTGGAGDETFNPICLPEQARCADERTLERCKPTGLAWESIDCGENRTCQCDSDETCEAPRCVGICEAEGIVPSSAGCSFIANRQLHLVDGLLEFHGVDDEREEPDGLVVANPDTERTVNAQLYFIQEGTHAEVPVGDPVRLEPGAFELFELASDFVQGTTTMFRSGGMFRLESDAPVVAYQHAPYRAFAGNDSSLLLPERSLGTDYVVASYPPHFRQVQGLGRPSYFEIIAVEDETRVRWHAQFAATAGNGLPIEEVAEGDWSEWVIMNRFDTLRVTASKNVNNDENEIYRQDVSGTVIESDKPIWVVGGSRCSRVPIKEELLAGYCDPLQELLLPLQYWGHEYVAAHPPLREEERHHWRIYAGDPEVTVTFDPPVAPPHTFSSRGEFIDITVPNGESFVVDADGPVLPVGYLESRGVAPELPEETADFGDPAMYQLVPTGQYLERYAFATGIDFNVHWLQVVRPIGGAEIRVDGTPVTGFTPIGEYEVANVEVSEGTHRVESEDAFGITQFGYAFGVHEACAPPLSDESFCNSSYAYPGGLRAEVINIP